MRVEVIVPWLLDRGVQVEELVDVRSLVHDREDVGDDTLVVVARLDGHLEAVLIVLLEVLLEALGGERAHVPLGREHLEGGERERALLGRDGVGGFAENAGQLTAAVARVLEVLGAR